MTEAREKSTRPRVLFVDDEQAVLNGLQTLFYADFEIATAISGAAGLEAIERDGPFAVVVSDMKMPGMDGAEFLQAVRTRHPDTARVLLTGQSSLTAAIRAVNQGQIFRFLTKPCPPDQLSDVMQSAARQYQLVSAERVLLEETLHGSIRVLTDLLAIASPTAFGRATRAKRNLVPLVRALGVAERWPIELAAMLSQIGLITLPQPTVDRLFRGDPLTTVETAMVRRVPMIAERLLENIPRIEPVREILISLNLRFDGKGQLDAAEGEAIPIGSRILRVLFDQDTLEQAGDSPEIAIGKLRAAGGMYDPSIVDAVARLRSPACHAAESTEITLSELRTGMVLAEDVTVRSGALLVAGSHEVTPSILERLRNFAETGDLNEPIYVFAAKPMATV